MDEDIKQQIETSLELLDRLSELLNDFPETKKFADRVDRIYRDLEQLEIVDFDDEI